MPYDDLREWLRAVEDCGELLRLSNVSPELEMSGIAEVLTRESKRPSPAILFDDIPGYPAGFRTLFGAFASARRMAMSLRLPENELDRVSLISNWRKKRRDLLLVPPKTVESAPVKEHILTGRDINVLSFPSPRFHELDGGRYFGTGDCVITRDPATGWVNLGTYRAMVVDRDRLALHMMGTQHGAMMFREYVARNQAMPVAIAAGVDPALLFAAITRVPWGVSEYEFAGGIRGGPVDVVSGPYTGLPIPASAEIVVEGECHPGETTPEGPFGEWHGYYANMGLESVPEPVVRVKTLLYRDAPILTCMHGGKPPHDYTLARSISQSALVWDGLDGCGVSGVAGVCSHECGGGSLLLVISVKTAYAGHSRQVALIASQIPQSIRRYTIVVDEDIDPGDLSEVMWAVATRADPERSVEIQRYCRSDSTDTAVSVQEKHRSGALFSSRAVIDACRPYDWKHEFYPVAQITPELRSALLKKWDAVFRGFLP